MKHSVERPSRATRLSLLPIALVLLLVPGGILAEDGQGETFVYREEPDDPPAEQIPLEDPLARSPATVVTVGPYTSHQVNVDSLGQNIVGDAANEPSIALNPSNSANVVIGWRQFDSISSNFRQAGWSFTEDGGQTWTFPGVLTPGNFRSDPVLDFDNGSVFYQSLQQSFLMDTFKSADGGASWGPPVPTFGGDKNWMAIDRTGGIGEGNIYGTWQRFFGCCLDATLTRSTDGGQSFEQPVEISQFPLFGTMAVGPNGELYVSGADGTFGQDLSTIVLTRSLDARNPAVQPTSDGTIVPIEGSMRVATGPNPAGLLGQVNVAVDRSIGPSRGNVYVLASVDPDYSSSQPMAVHLCRSRDRGETWDPFVRVNDDPLNNGSWHWFGAHAVAPDGRIDVIWNDTRNHSNPNTSELFYAYSYDAGDTWSANVQVSPPFNTHVGFPNQNKIGDYSTIRSDLYGGHVAYSATFNGEQDVYYVNVFPDCNDNGTSDVFDTEEGTSPDCNSNHVPDECEAAGNCVVAGETPDGKDVSGTQLTIRRAAGETIRLNWGASCLFGDTDYGIYEGAIGGDFTSHESLVCSTGGDLTIDLFPPEESVYYLVVPRKEVSEGSYSRDSQGDERPQGLNACRPQAIGSCGFQEPPD